MAASAFTKFDPFFFPGNREPTDTPAKPAKVAKVPPQAHGGAADTLALLATLAELGPNSENLESRPCPRKAAPLPP